nr:glycosyltransferase family 4 protein [Klenkia brasiliensis]
MKPPQGASVIGERSRRHFLWPLTLFIRLTRLWINGPVQLVHSHQRGVSLVSTAWGRLFRVRSVEHVHNVIDAGATRKLSYRADAIVACSQTVAAHVRERYPWTEARLHVVTNRVDDQSGTAVRTLSPDPADSLLKIVTLGRLEPEKRPLFAVRLCQALGDHGLNVSFHWFGGGSLQQEVIDAARVAQVKNFHVHGHSDDPARALASADVFLLCSEREGLPLALLEALSLSLPVVVPDVGGCREAVRDGQNGILFHPGDSASSVAALLAGFLKRVPLDRAGERSREVFVNNFALESLAGDLMRVYASFPAR